MGFRALSALAAILLGSFVVLSPTSEAYCEAAGTCTMIATTQIIPQIQQGTATIQNSIQTMQTTISQAIETSTQRIVSAIGEVGNGLQATMKMQMEQDRQLSSAQITALQTGLQNQAYATAYAMSAKDDAYGRPVTINGKTYQRSPHPTDACNSIDMARASASSYHSMINYAKQVGASQRTFSRGSMKSDEASFKRLESLPPQAYQAGPLISGDRPLDQTEQNSALEYIENLADPNPPKAPPAGSRNAADAQDYQAMLDLRNAHLDPARQTLTMLVVEQTRVVPDTTKIDTIWAKADPTWVPVSQNGLISRLDDLRFRATYDINNPQFDEELAALTEKGALSKISKQLATANAISFERYLLERRQAVMQAQASLKATHDQLDGATDKLYEKLRRNNYQ